MSGPNIPKALSIIWMKYLACFVNLADRDKSLATSAFLSNPKITLASGSKSKNLVAVQEKRKKKKQEKVSKL
jgi:hypothetical protein